MDQDAGGTVVERLRNLAYSEQLRIAREGDLAERTVCDLIRDFLETGDVVPWCTDRR